MTKQEIIGNLKNARQVYLVVEISPGNPIRVPVEASLVEQRLWTTNSKDIYATKENIYELRSGPTRNPDGTIDDNVVNHEIPGFDLVLGCQDVICLDLGEVLGKAAYDFFVSEWASAREEAGLHFPPGSNITVASLEFEMPSEDDLTRLVVPYVTRLTKAWGMGVGEMFELMEIPRRSWADALYYILMSCRGHGIGLDEVFGENIEIAEGKLNKTIDVSPFYDEFNDFSDLAAKVVAKQQETSSKE